MGLQPSLPPLPFKATGEQIKAAKVLNVDPLICYLLELRNITGLEAKTAFLHPSLKDLPKPFSMYGMQEATDLVYKAVRNKSDIFIWGDYDVDGITGTCLLVNFFEKIGIRAIYHIPNRFTDGYGLNRNTLRSLKKDALSDTPLLITVDCGISNVREIQLAKELGFDVIVTDHHEPGQEKINADAVLNPKQFTCSFSDQQLAGVGVAFYLAAGIRIKLKDKKYFGKIHPEPNLKQFLDFVAIGTIADMVPLTGANRILVRAGFEALATTTNQGIAALLQSCDIYNKAITSDDIGFQVGPKINAAGRMGEAELAVKLFLSKESDEAKTLAKKLTRLNLSRRKTTNENLEYALSIPHTELLLNDNCIVYNDDFHLGVIGIVCSQLTDILQVPVILLTEVTDSKGDVYLKGSGRSIYGLNLFECLCECSEFLIQFGGHKMAAGLTLKKEALIEFQVRFSETVAKKMKKEGRKRQKEIDAEVQLEAIFEEKLLDQLLLLEPFGEGNRRPIFLDRDPLIFSTKVVGKNGDHLKIMFRGKYSNHEGIGFGLGNKQQQLRENRSNPILFTPILNRFKNSAHWKVKVVDAL